MPRAMKLDHFEAIHQRVIKHPLSDVSLASKAIDRLKLFARQLKRQTANFILKDR